MVKMHSNKKNFFNEHVIFYYQNIYTTFLEKNELIHHQNKINYINSWRKVVVTCKREDIQDSEAGRSPSGSRMV